MSSAFIKAVKCFNCLKYFVIEEIGFPEDVFESIRKHKLDKNLLFKCDSCRNIGIGLPKSFAVSTIKSPAAHGEISVNYQDNLDEDDCATKSDLPSIISNSTTSPSSDKDKSARKYTASILKSIKIPHEDQSKNKFIINEVLESLLNTMKENEEFRVMMNRCYYTGSAYNDLKIIAATEYDINLILKVPKYIELCPEYFDENCAFLKLKWQLTGDVKDNSLKFFTENSDKNFLCPKKVLSWLQRHIDLALQKDIKWPADICKVVNSASGPARTVVITTCFGYSISVDLVPVFEFEYSHLSTTKFYNKMEQIAIDKNGNNNFFAVPKMCTEETNISAFDSKLCWRLDFPNAEKYILSGKECAKSVIKILKMIRDKINWKGIASYYLKMVVILEILKNPSKEHWQNGNEYQRLLDSLIQLANYLMDGYLPHFLTQHNLFQKLNIEQCKNCSNYLKHKILSWESNPAKIVEFLNDDKDTNTQNKL